jgi:hypothetical protein
MRNKITNASLVLTLIAATSACTPEIGSEAWCEDMAEKPKGDWTVNEAAEYAQSCVFNPANEN